MGQGALAVECRIGDDRVIKILNELNHKETVLSVIAERAFMRKLVSRIFDTVNLSVMLSTSVFLMKI